jgi:SAM-dependent methyltransferase
MDLSTLSVPPTLANLGPLLPEPPARVLEAGCGRGALAAALAEWGYQVTGVDCDAGMAAAARARGVSVIEADVRDVSGEYDVVLFTRSLHHAEDLDATLAHAATLLAPGGRIIIEEFAWERVDHAGAHFVHDNRAMLVATGLLDADLPSGDLLEAWVAGHDSLHRGSAMLAALSRVGADPTTVPTSMLWRLVDGRGGAWVEPATRAADALAALREAEERRIGCGLLAPVGLLASVRRP